MNRIDVEAAEKGKFKVMHNFQKFGCSLSSIKQANLAAWKLLEAYPKATVKYMEVPE